MIRLLGLDIDGTLTDGSIYMGPDGELLKVFHAQDGHGIKRLSAAGFEVKFITGRPAAPALLARLREWGMDPEHCLFAGVSDKLATAKHILARLDMELCEMAYMGDDLPDLELLQAVGLSAAPGDAVPEVRCEVQVVTNKLAGRGAVREFTELLLNQQLSSRQS